MKKLFAILSVAIFAFGCAIPQPAFSQNRIPSDTLTLGKKTNTTKTMIFDNGGATPPALRYNVGTSNFQFSNDGTTFLNMAQGQLSTVTTSGPTYNATAADDIIFINNSANGVTVNLPAASTVTGKIYRFRTNSSAFSAVIDPNGSEAICGQSTVLVFGPDDNLTVVSDGSNWIGLENTCNQDFTAFIDGSCGSGNGNINFGISLDATGRCIINIQSGYWSAAPKCTCTVNFSSGAGLGNRLCEMGNNTTTTQIFTGTSQGGGGLSAYDYNIQCVGPR